VGPATTRGPARRRLLAPAVIAPAVIALAVLAAGCLGHTGGGSVPPGASLVQVYHMAFRPRIVRVRVGQTVTWRFEDGGVEHNVDSREGDFRSPNQDSGTWSRTFTAPGTYSYFCSVHPYMTGQVIVGNDVADARGSPPSS
jgi:plastocyanin